MVRWNNIVLIGMMGSGKSSVGNKLADYLGWTFVDSDHLIETQEGKTIPELFAQSGEAHFRKVESGAIAAIMSNNRQVIATGGGAVLSEENRGAMLQGGMIVALKASADTIISRVSGDANRPLLKGDAYKEVPLIMERRKHAYDFAHVIIDTDGQTIDEVVKSILAAVQT